MTSQISLEEHRERMRQTAPRLTDRRSVASELYEILVGVGGWWTLPELRSELERRGFKALDTAISARLRDLRRAPYNRTVHGRVRDGASHLWEYNAEVAHG